MRGLVLADDGYYARPNQEYAEQKLDFFKNFCPPALKVTQRKFQRIFVDLFAGPGRNVDKASGRNFESAALRVLQMTAPNEPRLAFTHAKLINLRPSENGLLERRIERLHEERLLRVRDVECLRGDANVVGPRVLRELRASFGRGAYTLVFADPESPSQLPWSTVESIGREGPESTDLYILVPLDMGINRMLAYLHDRLEPNAQALTTYFGTEEWRPIVTAHSTDAQRAQLRAAMLDLYVKQLKLSWPYVEEVRAVNRIGDQRLYRMLFCTRNKAALALAHWERRSVMRGGQIELYPGFGIA
jgi:three-Cys-motif partner protein